MLLRRIAVILSAFLIVVSCQKRQDLIPERPEPTFPSIGNPNLGPLEFILNTDDNAAVLFGYELVAKIREIQVGCAILKREEELDFNNELEGMMKSYQQTESEVSKRLSRGDISEEEKERIERNFRTAFSDMNEERTDELVDMQRHCDKRLKRLLDSKKMEAIGYAEALLKTDPAKFTQLCFEITDYRRQIKIGLDGCLQFYEGKFGADPADLCYEDALNILLEFMEQLISEISQLPQQIYGDDEDFVNMPIPGSGEGVMGSGEGMTGSGEEPIPRVTYPSVPAPPAENQPNQPIDYDTRKIVRIHIPTKEEEPLSSKPPTDSEGPPPSTDEQPSSEPPTGTKRPTKIRVFTPTDKQPSSQPPTDSEGPRKTPPSTDKRPDSEPTKGPTKIRVFTPTDEQPSSRPPTEFKPPRPQTTSAPPTTRAPTTEEPVTKMTLPPKSTFSTRPTEVGPTDPEGNKVSRPTLPSKAEEPRKELPPVAVDQGTNEILDEEEESPSPEVEGKLEIDLPGVGVDVQVGDDGVEVDVDVTTETPQDGDESENVPNTAGTVEIISDYGSEEASEHRRPDSSSEHSSVGQSEQVHVDTDESEGMADEDSGSKGEEGEEEEEEFNYQHILIYAFMIVGSLLVIVIVILIIAILAVRRRRNRFKDTPLLSEEQKVAIMKQTGYVNPTYKFFDQVNDS